MPPYGGAVDRAEAGCGKMSEKDVLFSGEVRGERVLLVNDDDPMIEGITRREKMQLSSLHKQLTRIELVNSAQQLDQRRLAGSILPYDGVDLA